MEKQQKDRAHKLHLQVQNIYIYISQEQQGEEGKRQTDRAKVRQCCKTRSETCRVEAKPERDCRRNQICKNITKSCCSDKREHPRVFVELSAGTRCTESLLKTSLAHIQEKAKLPETGGKKRSEERLKMEGNW